MPDHPTPMNELQYHTINGLKYAVRVSGTGTPILCLHGFPDSHKLWRKMTPYLVAAGFQVIAPDLRGFGETDAPKGVRNYQLSIVASDCLELLDALGVKEPCYLMGHDWGAALGWALAIQAPDRFKKYVALSVGHITAFAFAGPAQLLKSWYMVFFHLGPFAEWVFKRKQFAWSIPWLAFPEEAENHVADLSRPGRVASGMNWYRANVMDAFIKKFGSCPIPVMGVWSDGDKFLNEQHIKKGTQKYMSAPYRYEKTEGSNHWIPLQKPEELSLLVIDFLV